FFQAEDGIRDLTVTGVQTCALPIFHRPLRGPRGRPWSRARQLQHGERPRQLLTPVLQLALEEGSGQLLSLPVRIVSVLNRQVGRSEERRVGKEGRCGGGWCDEGGSR